MRVNSGERLPYANRTHHLNQERIGVRWVLGLTALAILGYMMCLTSCEALLSGLLETR